MGLYGEHFTEKENDDLLRLFAEGKTYDQIGKILKRNRNSIAGRISRLRGKKIITEARKLKIIVKNKKRIAVPKIKMKKIKVRVVPKIEFGGILLKETRDFFQCRFPLGDTLGENMKVCGEMTVNGTSWCEKHRKIVFTPRAAPSGKPIVFIRGAISRC
jgi:hypothetical protein